MGRLRIAIPLGLALSVVSAPSLAADYAVRATSSSTFSPQTVTVNVGDTVTWRNDGGFHNVHFEDGSFEQPADPSFAPWTVSRDFKTPGTFKYFCEQHQNTGMVGTVVVQESGAPPPPPSDTTGPDIDSLRIAPATFCNKKTDACPKRGARLRFTIDEAADVSGKIIRRSDKRQVGTLSIDAKVGSNSFAFSGKGLKLGKYLLELTARDATGNTSPVNRTGFKVATKR